MNSHPLCRLLLLPFAFVLLASCSRDNTAQKSVARAQAYYDAGNYESALVEYQNVLQQDPQSPTAIAQIGRIWMARGAPMRALPYVAKAYNASPGDLDLRRDMLRLSLALGKLGEARTHALAILERAPSDKSAILALAAASRAEPDLVILEKTLRSADHASGGYHLGSAVLMQRRGNTTAAHTNLQRALTREPKWPEVHAAIATFLASQGDFVAAKEEYRRAAELAPVRSEERMKYAEFLAQTGMRREAVAYLTRISRQVPDYLPAWRGLAAVAIVEQRFDDGLAHLQNAFRCDPGNFECEITRSVVLLAKNDTKAAVDALEALGKRFPGASVDKYQLAIAHLQAQDAERAREALRRAVAQNPDYDDAIVLLARIDLRSGNAEAAAVAMAELLSVRPDFIAAEMLLLDALKSLGQLDDAIAHLRSRIVTFPDRADLHRLLGLLLKYQKNYAEARRSLQRSLELSPGFLPVVAELVDLEIKEGKYEAAINVVHAQAANKPGSPALSLLAARVHFAQGRWDDAEAGLVEALNLDPAYTPAYDLLRRTLAAQTDAAVAVKRLEQFLAKKPGDFRALLVAGDIYTGLGEYTKARDAYEACLKNRPDSTVVLNNLAFLYSERLPQPARAFELASRARQLDRNTPEIADTLGLILYRRQAYAAALDLLKESASKLPAVPEVQYHLGLCAQALKQDDVARAAFHRATTAPQTFAGKADAQQRLAALGGPPDSPPAVAGKP